MTYDNDIWRAYLTLHGFCSRLACLVCFLPLHDFRDLTNDLFSSHWWQYLTRHGMIGWYDIHDMTWHNVTWHDTTWHDETHMAWQYMPWGDTTLRDRQWHCVTVLYHSRIIPRHLFNRILHHNVPFYWVSVAHHILNDFLAGSVRQPPSEVGRWLCHRVLWLHSERFCGYVTFLRVAACWLLCGVDSLKPFCEEILWGTACWCGGVLVAGMLLVSAAPSEFFMVVQRSHCMKRLLQPDEQFFDVLQLCDELRLQIALKWLCDCSVVCAVLCCFCNFVFADCIGVIAQRLWPWVFIAATVPDSLSCWTNLLKRSEKFAYFYLPERFGERAEWRSLQAWTSMIFLLDRPACLAPLWVNFRDFIWGARQVFFFNSPNSVSTLRGSYGSFKGRCLIRVLTLVCGLLPVNFCKKCLLWNLDLRFDCAGLHKTSVCVLGSFWSAAFFL